LPVNGLVANLVLFTGAWYNSGRYGE